jgi:uncharacterized protein involved in outer membrane biogenesis
MSLSSVRSLIRIFYFLLIFCATLVTLLIVFLSQLDLNDYRLSLERQLSTALNQPVSIGHSSLTYSKGLALELKQLQIGPDDSAFAKIPRLIATLQLAPLFNREFILEQVRIDNPLFQVRLPLTERPAKGASHSLLNSLGISILTVHNAQLEIYQSIESKAVKRFELTSIHAVLRGWQANQSGRLVVSGQIPRYNASILLETKLPASSDPQVWRQEEHETQLKISGFSAAEFPQLKGQEYPEALDLEVNIHGAPANGTLFNALLTGAKSREKIFSLAGRWTSSQTQDAITDLSGELLTVPLTGEFHYLRQADKNYLAGRFGAKNVQLDQQLLHAWRIPQADKLLKGELERLGIVVEKSWESGQPLAGLPRIGAEVTLSNLSWDIPELKQLQDLSVDLSLENKNLLIQDGILVAGGDPIEFSGQIQSLLEKPKIALHVNFNPQLNNIKSAFKRLEQWEISGNVPGTLKLNGPILRPDFQLQADLGPTRLRYPSLLLKQTTDQAKLSIKGNLSRNRVKIDLFNIQLADSGISASGYFEKTQEGQVYSLTTQPIILEQLTPFSPILKKLRAQGEVAAELVQNRNGLQSTIVLKNVGGHLTRVLGELKNTSGKIHLDRHGLSFQKLQAALGESAFVVDGLLSDWGNPQISLDVRGTNIRAHDLIFTNPKMRFYDLDGHLKINSSGIKFSPVNVRLEQNTVATVSGAVTDFSDPQVDLDIQAETVDVLDIIRLFEGSKEIGPEKQMAEHKPLRIQISAKQGSLGGLQFRNAEGLLKNNNHRLTIFPLNFRNGDGWCQARVELDHRERHTPLKISGHVEGINASILHQDLFAKQGLINGSLRGDFHIEGYPAKDRFWEGARGGLHLQVRDGTLRKFHGLAQVFSLLNVSQIFAGKLPDMDKEGMPFSLMEGSVKIANGQMTTEDLKITSEAMNLSLIGTQSLLDDRLDFNLGVMPLRTVDKVITSIPIAGWVLTGKDKALLTAHFKIEGTTEQPKVTPVPIDSVSKTVFGILKRTLGLPGKLVKDVGTLIKKEPEKKTEP